MKSPHPAPTWAVWAAWVAWAASKRLIPPWFHTMQQAPSQGACCCFWGRLLAAQGRFAKVFRAELRVEVDGEHVHASSRRA